MEGINIYDQEQCNKERGTRIQPWVISYLGVWRRKEATEGDGSKQPPRAHTYTHTHPGSKAALWLTMLLRHKHLIRRVVQ